MTYIDWTGDVRTRLAGLRLEPAREAEIVDELSQHLDQRYEDLLAAGMSGAEARRSILDELDGPDVLARYMQPLRQARTAVETVPGAPRRSFAADVWQDVRYAVRTLRKQPGFAAAALLTLALGIGATTAIFSLINAAVLRALPYPDPDRLVVIWAGRSGAPGLQGLQRLPPANADIADWRRHTDSFAHVAAFAMRSADLTDGEIAERVGAAAITTEFFDVLGVQPVLGRALAAGEDVHGGPPVALIGHGLWQRRFGGDRDVIGRTIAINGKSHTVVGVLPPDFDFPRGAEWQAFAATSGRTEVWLPIAFRARDDGSGWSNWESRVERGVTAIGRVKADLDRRQAQAEMDAFAARAAADYPASHKDVRLDLVPMRDQLAAHASRSLLILFAAVGVLFLIACVNAANLLLARGVSRAQETAVRTAMGASRGRLVRQLLTECAVHAMLATGLGLLVAQACIAGFLALNPATYSRLNDASLDRTVLLFAAAVAAIATALFGIVPAIHGTRLDLRRTLYDNRGESAGRERVRAWMVGAQVAMAVVLLTATGLVARSLLRVLGVQPGFRAESVLAIDVQVPAGPVETESSQTAAFQQVIERIEAVPSVRAAGAISFLPLGGGQNRGSFVVEGAPAPPPGSEPRAERRLVTPGYFAAMGIPIRQGRVFTAHDTMDQPRVAVINEAIARQFFPAGDAIGRRVRSNGVWREIVGIVADVKSTSLERDPGPQIYMPHLQFAWGIMTVVVRTDASPLAIVPTVRREIKAAAPLMPVANVRTMDQIVARASSARRFDLAMLGFFAGSALLLTLIGIYGVVAFLVSRRSREIGIRLALGAQRDEVLRLILRQGMKPVALGVAAGLTATIGTSRIVESQLFGISPRDPLTLGAIAALVSSAALIACWLPARRATRLHPVDALRSD
jgi:putative ABC transport system permease protein